MDSLITSISVLHYLRMWTLKHARQGWLAEILWENLSTKNNKD